MRSESSSEPSGQAEPERPRILLGTAGFHFDDWVGPFYPNNLQPSSWFEFYAQEFPCLELNATFYTWIATRTMQRFADRAPERFRFNVKVHRSLTHEIADLDKGVAAMLDTARPLREADKFGCFLAQFPQSFHPSPQRETYVQRLAESLQPLCVEFRSADWQSEGSARLAEESGFSIVAVDGPSLEGLPTLAPPPVSSRGYVRLHGRNRGKWYRHEEAWERYDYLYSEDELKEVVPVVLDVASRVASRASSGASSEGGGVGETYVVFNNHYGAQAVTNARQMAALLGLPHSPAQGQLF
ncbi:MAG: DUF72 domain-containing protein [Armatimonadota bacterium]